MKSENQNGTSTPKIKHRLILPIEGRGNIGKSTEAVLRAEWLRQNDVPWKGYDLDSANRTLSAVYPTEVSMIEPSREPVADVIKILRKVPQTAVTIVDPQAHMNKTILSAIAKAGFLKFAADANVRMSVLLFPIDSASDMKELSETVDALGSAVDWIIVKNQERIPTTKFFDRSPLEKQLQGFKAAYLEVPALLTDTRNHITGVQVQLGRNLSPSEIIRDPSLKIDLVHRAIYEQWVAEAFRNFYAIRSYLVPHEYVERMKPPTDLSTKVSQPESGINLEEIL
jgi:hypothetical protein